MSLSKKRILFVDDEEEILQAHARSLRADSARWDMVFVLGGEAALEALREGPYDAVVTDMQMPPGINGAALLAQVRQQWPATVQIMVSGSGSAATSIDADAAFAKPLDAKKLRAVLERLMSEAE